MTHCLPANLMVQIIQRAICLSKRHLKNNCGWQWQEFQKRFKDESSRSTASTKVLVGSIQPTCSVCNPWHQQILNFFQYFSWSSSCWRPSETFGFRIFLKVESDVSLKHFCYIVWNHICTLIANNRLNALKSKQKSLISFGRNRTQKHLLISDPCKVIAMLACVSKIFFSSGSWHYLFSFFRDVASEVGLKKGGL